ncbi:MAG TPA: antitoxin family protein [Pirellulales bacterium]
MPISIDAIYENGVLRPLDPLPFLENARIRITLDLHQSWADITAGMVPRPDDVSVLEEIAMGADFELGELP